MAYIPADAQWYLAEIVEDIMITGEEGHVVHVNLVLVRADSPDNAYEAAMALGKEGEAAYKNTDGHWVTVTFRGLRDLHVIHDALDHGAELLYEQQLGLTEAQIDALIRPKEQLGIFRPRRAPQGPKFAAKAIVDELPHEVSEVDGSEAATC